jgi:sulfite reductase (NADPH) hemoprotein beta-component
MLNSVFTNQLEISNAPSLVSTSGPSATLPEFAFGKVQSDIAQRTELIEAAEGLVSSYGVDKAVHAAFSKWLQAKNDPKTSRDLGEKAITILRSSDAASHAAGKKILSLESHVGTASRWIIGSDAWSYDLGASGVHHAIASGQNINMLIIDSVPYTERDAAQAHKRKKDIGLYAMNHGDVYVASVAVYSSYSQVLQALVEADKFQGPSIVLAYLPYAEETSSALDVLKETKLAVDTGYWPLYRWDPSKEAKGEEVFSLDSEKIKLELQEFLDRQSHLSQLTNAEPSLASELVESLGEKLLIARKDKAKEAYEKMLSAFDGPPLLVLYASDGGAAQKVAQRLATRAGLRGLSSRCLPMDEMSIEDLKLESHVAFVTSTAGQGEFPQNARQTWKAFNALASGEQPFGEVKYSVFAMGDSHYWPRPEDAHYYNKSGKDLDAKLEALGAERMAGLGLGDDQDADGAQTGYKVWEPTFWKAMGVDHVEVTEAEPEPITNEHIKISSNYLRGTIAEVRRSFPFASRSSDLD